MLLFIISILNPVEMGIPRQRIRVVCRHLQYKLCEQGTIVMMAQMANERKCDIGPSWNHHRDSADPLQMVRNVSGNNMKTHFYLCGIMMVYEVLISFKGRYNIGNYHITKWTKYYIKYFLV